MKLYTTGDKEFYFALDNIPKLYKISPVNSKTRKQLFAVAYHP